MPTAEQMTLLSHRRREALAEVIGRVTAPRYDPTPAPQPEPHGIQYWTERIWLRDAEDGKLC